VPNRDQRTSDVEAILARRHDNGDDYWASPEGKIYVGNPFSTITALAMLHELEVTADHEAAAGGLELILEACRDDGRIRVGPKSPMYPCYTAEAARVLCRFDLTEHPAVERTVEYLLDSTHDPAGWRCSFSRFGKGPETECANPGATLYALDALRFYDELRAGRHTVDAAVEFLLSHWESRSPIGPCHWGIGSTFIEVEYPFVRYNIFLYVYVLSFFDRAKRDPRFLDALEHLESKVDADGALVVERPHRRLKGLHFCARGRPSTAATRRLLEVRRNLA
jgi:hypothetical protein